MIKQYCEICRDELPSGDEKKSEYWRVLVTNVSLNQIPSDECMRHTEICVPCANSILTKIQELKERGETRNPRAVE